MNQVCLIIDLEGYHGTFEGGQEVHGLFDDADAAYEYAANWLVMNGVADVGPDDTAWLVEDPTEVFNTHEELVEAFNDTLTTLEYFHLRDFKNVTEPDAAGGVDAAADHEG